MPILVTLLRLPVLALPKPGGLPLPKVRRVQLHLRWR